MYETLGKVEKYSSEWERGEEGAEGSRLCDAAKSQKINLFCQMQCKMELRNKDIFILLLICFVIANLF